MSAGAYVQANAANNGNGELTTINDTSASNSGNKRRRTSDDTNINHLTHLPNDQLVNIADYLTKTSRALFAVALSAPSSSFRKLEWRVEYNALHAASRAIISSATVQPTRRSNPYSEQRLKDYYAAGWGQLDLMRDIDANLAAKITDDDIGAVLVCIDAKNTMKMLRLKNCQKVVGHCLEPLRGSVVLEEFYASNIYFSNLGSQPPFSEAAVVPILESIIDTDGNSLRKVSLPLMWRKGEIRNEPPLSEFYTKFNALMLSEQVKCLDCPKLCEGNTENSCQICCRRMCADCDDDYEDELGDDGPFVRSCDNCSKNLCQPCGEHHTCRECDSVYCSVCAKDDGVDAGQYCENNMCGKESLCLGCRVPEEHYDCWGCQHLIYPKLLEEKQRVTEDNERLAGEKRRLAEKNGELHKENSELHKENYDLHKEVDELREQNEELRKRA